MGKRLRSHSFVAALAAVLLLPLAAVSSQFVSCWVTTERNPASLQMDQVTRCRIAGGDTVDYASDSDVPKTLYPNLGTDLTGQCWFLTSVPTAYVILARYADGSADVGLDTDPSNPGGIIAIGPTLPRCTSEPTPLDDPTARVWDYVMSYIHDPPLPDLSPPPGDGVTGLETFVGLSVPPDHAATLSAGGTSIEVEIEVPTIVIDWGDGMVETYPATGSVLAGYPDGSATHVYEVKDEAGVDLTVEYDWWARWRTPPGPWIELPVPNTTTSVLYPIAEIVSRLQP